VRRPDAAGAAVGWEAVIFPLSPCVLGRGVDVDGSCFPGVDTALILLASTNTDGHV
jgi:hypothetical protein